jgi:hypothetical protein
MRPTTVTPRRHARSRSYHCHSCTGTADVKTRFGGHSLRRIHMDLLLYCSPTPSWHQHGGCAELVWRVQSVMLVLNNHNRRRAREDKHDGAHSGLMGAGCLTSLSITMIEPCSLHVFTLLDL